MQFCSEVFKGLCFQTRAETFPAFVAAPDMGMLGQLEAELSRDKCPQAPYRYVIRMRCNSGHNHSREDRQRLQIAGRDCKVKITRAFPDLCCPQGRDTEVVLPYFQLVSGRVCSQACPAFFRGVLLWFSSGVKF